MRSFSFLNGRRITLKRIKPHSQSPKVLGIVTLCLFLVICNIATISNQSSRRQINTPQSIIKSNPESDLIPKECVVNQGKAIAHDKDSEFVAKPSLIIDEFKQHYDDYKMPEIQIIEPSFYFQTTDPMKLGKSWPALSRAWNETRELGQ